MWRAIVVASCILTSSCASTIWWARRPQAERSAYIAAASLSPGMRLHDVVSVAVGARRPNQYASVSSNRTCNESVAIVMHVGERIAKVNGTSVFAADFASIDSMRTGGMSMKGFERQSTLLEEVRSRQAELLVCRNVTLAFDAVTEGGCGTDTVALTFGEDGQLMTVGPVVEEECAK
jgi:hypothetical protein